jgi:hypothetical protein
MRALLFAAALCWFSTAHALVEEPPKTGVYVRVSGEWTALEAIKAASGKKHVARVAVHGQPLKIVWVFRYAHAPVKVLGASVELFVRDVPGFDERDVLIVKLDVKKDHRELQTTSGGNLSTFTTGIGRKRAPEFEAHKISDHTYSIVPREHLHRGEYMITVAPGMSGYDFTAQ